MTTSVNVVKTNQVTYSGKIHIPKYLQCIIDKQKKARKAKNNNYLIIYNNESVDSIVATCLFAGSLSDEDSIYFYSYNPLDEFKVSFEYNQVYIMGVELDRKILNKLALTKEVKIFTYRNNYKDVKNKNIEIIYPCEDFYNEKQTIIDNSVTNIMNQYLDTIQRYSIFKDILLDYRNISLYYNIQPLEDIKDIDNFYRIYLIKNKFKYFLNTQPQFKEFKHFVNSFYFEESIENEIYSHNSYIDNIKKHIERNIYQTILTYKEKGLFGKTDYHVAEIVTCNENISRDVMRILVYSKQYAMTLEHVRDFKLYRIFFIDKNLEARAIKCLNPFYQWKEGEVTVLACQ